MSAQQIIAQLKESDQDFEWYPTTQEMINVVKNSISDNGYYSVLDVGAGDGRVLDALDCSEKYAIEKSTTLIQAMPRDIIMLGTDFYSTTFLDKQVDVIFCNPPYSDYKNWSKTIIKQAQAQFVYLVIPERWKHQAEITQAIKDRGAKYEVIYSGDFLNAERQARAKIDIVQITYEKYGKNNAFELWFNEQFGDLEQDDTSDYERKEQKKEEINHELISAENPITTLVGFYHRDLSKLQNDYGAITNLKSNILKNIGVDKDKVLSSLKLNIKGLKALYWKMLFERMDKLTYRLTSWSRSNFLQTITSNTSVDFNTANINAVVIWVLKNAYFTLDEQVVEWYERMLDVTNCKAYKSNEKVFGSYDWTSIWGSRGAEELSKLKVQLLHRIVISHGYDSRWEGTLNAQGSDYLSDIITIAREFGYPMNENAGYVSESGDLLTLYRYSGNVQTGTKYYLYSRDNQVLCEIKAFKNGNIHIKFNKEFITKINVIYGRLKGWLQSKEQADEELGKGASKYYDYKLPKIDSLLQIAHHL